MTEFLEIKDLKAKLQHVKQFSLYKCVDEYSFYLAYIENICPFLVTKSSIVNFKNLVKINNIIYRIIPHGVLFKIEPL
jgi:hypothetical protein